MKKTLIFLFLFVIHSLRVLCQTHSNEIIIAREYFDAVVNVIAAKYSDNNIWIDNDFNLETMEFIPRFFVPAEQYPAIKEINSLSIAEILETKAIIDSTNCDYVNPIYIIYKVGEKSSKVNWNGIVNCYPEKIKFIEELDKQFRALKEKYIPVDDQ